MTPLTLFYFGMAAAGSLLLCGVAAVLVFVVFLVVLNSARTPSKP